MYILLHAAYDTSISAGCLRCAQGIDRLTLIFSQLVIASLAVSTITTLEVAVKWPEAVVYVSVLFFLVAVVRCCALRTTLFCLQTPDGCLLLHAGLLRCTVPHGAGLNEQYNMHPSEHSCWMTRDDG